MMRSSSLKKKNKEATSHDRSQEDDSEADITWAEIRWIMQVVGGETKILKWLVDPASGGHCWYMKCGNYITLAELFHQGIHLLSCYDLYRAYKSLPICTHKRFHSCSHSAEAQLKRNARLLRYNEEGKWTLRKWRYQ